MINRNYVWNAPTLTISLQSAVKCRYVSLCIYHKKMQGDQIVVGDLMRSMCVLTYKSMEGIFEEVARYV